MSGIPHGTISGYSNHRCRCEACRAANASYKRQWKADNQGAAPDHVHGTAGGYNNYGCRCEACMEAIRAQRRSWAAAAKNRPVPRHVHGTTNGYANYGCRCTDCRAANAARGRRQRDRKREEAS